MRYCHQGMIVVHFVGIKNVAKGDAQTIERGNSWESKLVGTGTDGASNMLEKNNGFVAKLKNRIGRPSLDAF